MTAIPKLTDAERRTVLGEIPTISATELRRRITGRQCRVRAAGTWLYVHISHGAAYNLRDRLSGRITVDIDTDVLTAYIAVARGAEEPDA